VFRHASTSDDSDSDRGNVENGGTNASERTPLLASGARSAATASSRGMCYLGDAQRKYVSK